MPNALARLSAAVPDTITAITYAIAWVAPSLLGVEWVRALLIALVVEFMVMHASALYSVALGKREDRLRKRAVILGALTALYLLPIGALAFSTQTLAPVLSFLWLFTSRFAHVIVAEPAAAAVETQRAKSLWLVSLGAFAAGVVLVNKLPPPAFGLTPEFVASLSMSGHPDPNAQPPQMSIAFGVFYFIVQACAKAMFAPGAVTPTAAAASATGRRTS